MPEIPELVYDSLRQSKNLQHSMDKIARELQSSRVRQGQSRYLFGIGATLLLSGTLLLINRPDWQMMPARLMAGGVVVWLAGWRKRAEFASPSTGRIRIMRPDQLIIYP